MEQPVKNELRPRTLRFGVFEVDPCTQELRKQGVRVRLPAQSIQILLMLLETPGQLVNREELRNKLWPEDTFVDFDHGVNAAVNRLREALGDSAEKPKFIETLPRRGYRFVAPVDGAGEVRVPPQDAAKDFSDVAVAATSRDGGPQQQQTPTVTPEKVRGTSPRIRKLWRMGLIVAASVFTAAIVFGIWILLLMPRPRRMMER
jgi:DNA-binding winged helix-turn-helix (wHTH) protein